MDPNLDCCQISPLAAAGPLLDLVVSVPNLLPKWGGSHIVFGSDNHSVRKCCPHFTDEGAEAGWLCNRPKVTQCLTWRYRGALERWPIKVDCENKHEHGAFVS